MSKSYYCVCHGKPASSRHQQQPPNASLGTWGCPVTGKKCKVKAEK